MRILIVDDMEERHESLRVQLEGHDLYHRYDGPTAAQLIESERFDVMFLDHDLTEAQMCGEEDEFMSGTEVARLVAGIPAGRRPAIVVVHSWNPAGARRMCSILVGHGMKIYRFPFSTEGMGQCLLP